jgi:hypothetical protein
MQRRAILITALRAGLLAGAGATLATLTGCATSSSGTGWTPMIDGKSLAGWNQIGAGNWRIEDGMVVGDRGKAGFLVTSRSYKDFMIRAEFWSSDDANSGIFIRCTDAAKVTGDNAYEVNIFDKRPDPTYATGAIVNVAKPAVMIKAGGQWNVYEITAKGDTFTVTLNGTRTVDGVRDAKHANGLIALQSDGGVIKFRKLEIREL